MGNNLKFVGFDNYLRLFGDKTFVKEDGKNANRQAMDYQKNEHTLKKGDKISIRLARNGGFAAIIESFNN